MHFAHFTLALFALSSLYLARAQVTTISLKKGEAFDLLLLTYNDEAEKERKEYFEKAVAEAETWGYKPRYYGHLTAPPTQGNYWPEYFLMASWDNYDKRVEFIDYINKKYPVFKQRRRKIWPTFHLTYWKVSEDQEFVMDPEKCYIATCYWSSEDKAFSSFKSKLQAEINQHGGKVIAAFTDGTSPFGYHYNPELFTIVEWRSKEDFDLFYHSNLALDHKGVENVNQFILP